MINHNLVYKVKAVIFDMDGVITDTMTYHMRAWKIVLERHGLKVTKNDIYKREGQRGFDSVHEIFIEYGKMCSGDLCNRILAEKEDLFKKIVKRRFIAGSRLFLKTLHKKGFKLALVTGTARHEVLRILPASLFSLFDVVVCGCDVQNGKPHPEPYQTALKNLGILPREAVVIENAPFGIQSSKAAGIRCLAIETSLPSEFLSQADSVFLSFTQLRSKAHFELS